MNGADDESGFLKLKPTQEWIAGETESAPMNRKALAKVCHLYFEFSVFLSQPLLIAIVGCVLSTFPIGYNPFGFYRRHYGMTASEGRN